MSENDRRRGWLGKGKTDVGFPDEYEFPGAAGSGEGSMPKSQYAESLVAKLSELSWAQRDGLAVAPVPTQVSAEIDDLFRLAACEFGIAHPPHTSVVQTVPGEKPKGASGLEVRLTADEVAKLELGLDLETLPETRVRPGWAHSSPTEAIDISALPRSARDVVNTLQQLEWKPAPREDGRFYTADLPTDRLNVTRVVFQDHGGRFNIPTADMDNPTPHDHVQLYPGSVGGNSTIVLSGDAFKSLGLNNGRVAAK